MAKKKYSNVSFISSLLNAKLIVIVSNIVFQGMRYMSFGERLYKLGFTFFPACLIYAVTGCLFFSLSLAHLFNYIVNGQFYVLFRYISSKKKIDREDLLKFIDIIWENISIFNPEDVVIIGSFSRGKMRGSSDLDIRIFHKKHLLSSLKAYIMATVLRFKGLTTCFPIDVYCFSDFDFLSEKKVRKDEIPVNFLKNQAFVKRYPMSKHVVDQLTNIVME